MAERYLAEELSNELSEAQLFTELTALDGEIVRELEARRTFHTTIGDGHYYVKLHFGVGWAEIQDILLVTLQLTNIEQQSECDVV